MVMRIAEGLRDACEQLSVSLAGEKVGVSSSDGKTLL